MRTKISLLLSAACAFSAAGIAAAQISDEYCMGTPVDPTAVQCACPTVTTEDFCMNNKPLPGTNEVIQYSCMNFSGMTCTPNGRNCGKKVYLCVDCHCHGGASNAGCNGTGCTPTPKVGFCGQDFGCS